jgi:hypothetical protein
MEQWHVGKSNRHELRVEKPNPQPATTALNIVSARYKDKI